MQLEWNVKRLLSKANYHIQTDAVQKYILPRRNYREEMSWLAYAEEADLLNIALWGGTARDWRQANPEAAKNGQNIRDLSSINELTVLANLECLNALMIQKGIEKGIRFQQLCDMATYQMNILENNQKQEIKE